MKWGTAAGTFTRRDRFYCSTPYGNNAFLINNIIIVFCACSAVSSAFWNWLSRGPPWKYCWVLSYRQSERSATWRSYWSSSFTYLPSSACNCSPKNTCRKNSILILYRGMMQYLFIVVRRDNVHCTIRNSCDNHCWVRGKRYSTSVGHHRVWLVCPQRSQSSLCYWF